MGVLTNVFMNDGSILYCAIEGIKTSMGTQVGFLIGMSLDGACKSYNTCPKKAKDLIKPLRKFSAILKKNGITGLCNLLQNKSRLHFYIIKIDCLCLMDLVQKMANACKLLFKENIFDYLTLSSMGYKICDNGWSGKKEFIKSISPS